MVPLDEALRWSLCWSSREVRFGVRVRVRVEESKQILHKAFSQNWCCALGLGLELGLELESGAGVGSEVGLAILICVQLRFEPLGVHSRLQEGIQSASDLGLGSVVGVGV